MSELTLEMNYTFTLPEKIKGITIVCGGVGGTGGHAVAAIARHIAAKELTDSDNNVPTLPVEMLLYDGDTVEQKNLKRQNFYRNDIGKYKAEVWAKKITNVFQIPAKAYIKYLEEASEVTKIVNDAAAKGYLPILIGGFDNPQPRKIFHDGIYAANGKAIWIDAGNNKYDGQVIVSAVNGRSLDDLERKGETSGFFNLPTICEIDTKTYLGPLTKTSEISCAEHTQEDPQTMDANTTAAHLIAVIVGNLIHGKGIKVNEIRFNTEATFESKSFNITASHIRNLKERHNQTIEDFKNGLITL